MNIAVSELACLATNQFKQKYAKEIKLYGENLDLEESCEIAKKYADDYPAFDENKVTMSWYDFEDVIENIVFDLYDKQFVDSCVRISSIKVGELFRYHEQEYMRCEWGLIGLGGDVAGKSLYVPNNTPVHKITKEQLQTVI